MFDIELAGRTSNSQRRRKNYRRWWKGYEQSQIWLFLLPMDWGFNECRSQKKKSNQDERRKWEKKDENRKSDHWEEYAGAGCRRNQWGRAGPAALPPLLVPCSVSVRRLRWTSGQQVSAQEGAGCSTSLPWSESNSSSCSDRQPASGRSGGEYDKDQERGDLIDKLLFLSWLLEISLCLKAACWWEEESSISEKLRHMLVGRRSRRAAVGKLWSKHMLGGELLWAALNCEQTWATFLFSSLISPPCHGASSQPWVRMNPQILWASDQTILKVSKFKKTPFLHFSLFLPS